MLKKITSILILENSTEYSKTIQENIERNFPAARIKFAASTVDFLEAYEKSKSTIIIIDCTVERFNEDIQHVIFNQNNFSPVIILTSSVNEELAEKCIQLGAFDYVLKENLRRLPIAIKNAIKERNLVVDLFFAENDLEEYRIYTEHYRRWEANVPGMVFLFVLHADGSSAYTYVSSASKKLFNLEPEEIVKNPLKLQSFRHPDDIDKMENALLESARTLESFRYSARQIINEELRWYEFMAHPKKYSNNDIVWDGIVLDITNQKRAEEKLREEHNLLRTLMDNFPDAIYFKDLESKFLKVNKGYLKKFKSASLESIIGKTDFELFDFEHAEKARQDEQKIIETETPIINKIEKEIVDGDKVCWVSTTKLPLRNSEGKIIGTFGISRDFTDIKRMEEILATERNLLRTLIDALPDRVFAKDSTGKFIINNKAHLNSLGLKNQDEAIGKSDHDFRSEEEANRLSSDDNFVMENGTLMYYREVLTSTTTGREEWYLATKAPLKDNYGNIIGIVGVSHDITESKKLEEQLRSSEARLRNLVTATSAVLYTSKITKDSYYHTWVGDNIKQFGYSPHEITKNDFWKTVIHPDDLDYYLSNMRLLLTENNLVIEYRIKDKKNNILWIRDEVVLIKDSFGAPAEIFGSYLDITERMKSEEALLLIESQLTNALKIARIAYWEYDVLKDTFIFNDQFYSLLGTTAEIEGGYTMTSKQYAESFVYSDDQHIVGVEVEKAITTKDPNFSSQLEHRINYKNGDVGYISVRFNIVKDAQGRTVKTYGANQDITERKKAEIALRESEYFLRKSQSVAQVGSYIFKVKEGIWHGSPTLYDILGVGERYPRTIKGWLLLMHEDNRDEMYNYMKNHVIKNRNRFEKEYKIVRANDKQVRWVLCLGDLECDKEGNPITLIGTLHDVTERVLRQKEKQELEDQLRERNSKLEKMISDIKKMQNSLVQSEKMASIGQLSAGIAHEINNPLAYVSSNVNRLKEYFYDTVELLKKWQELKPEIINKVEFSNHLNKIEHFTNEIDYGFILQDFDRMMASVQDGTQRIKKIVEGMRGFAFMNESSFAPAKINQAIDETLVIIWNELKYKVTLQKNYAELPLVTCNISEIKQVLVNLIVNAAHSIKEKGDIILTTFSEDDSVYIKIQDNGCGIPSKHLKRIFDPFFTTKEVGKGSGLGLWVSSTIVEKHGGSITVESEENFGSTFIIRLPISPEANNNSLEGK